MRTDSSANNFDTITIVTSTAIITFDAYRGSVHIKNFVVTIPDVTAPVANADTTSTTFNTGVTGINVLANDTDNSGVAPTLTGVLSNQVGGTFSVNAGKIDFTPTSGFTGAASVTYQIKDGNNNLSTGVLTVNVGADVTAPVANADTTSTTFNTGVTGINVLANDTDNSGVAPTLTGVLSNQVGGTFSVNAGKIDFTPTSGFTGAASVTYQIKDGNNNLSTGVLTVNVGADVTPPNTPILTLNSGGTYINSTTVPVSITGDTDNAGVTGWYVSESSSVPALASFGAEPTSVTISSGDGVHNLYAFTRDAAGNISAAGTSSVSLDTVAPASPVFNGATPSLQ